MKKKALALALVAPLALAACDVPVQGSASTYRQGEVGLALLSTEHCRVVQARPVRIVGDPSAGGQVIGTAAGAIIGAAIGSNIGGGSGRTVATALGTVGGAAVGSRAASGIETANRTSTGVEYTVQLGPAQRVVVQNIGPGERVLPAGADCRFVGDGRTARVLPI